MADKALATYVCDLHAVWLAEAPERRWRDEPGTLVFFDVSGFTPLTERLAARGKEGGEELTDVLNRVFGALLGAAERLGGDTLKFGGDAVFILFEGEGHERRACAAAFDMQAAMRGFRRLKTSAGVIALGASCGVASGPVHAFLVGDVFRELVIAGPTTSAALQMEQAAEPGEILVDASTQTLLRKRELGPEREGGRPLAARPDAADVPHADRPQADPRLALPPGLVPYLSHTTEGEHRLGVISFLQFKGLDELLRDDGPDAAADELEELIGTVQRCCEQHRITFLATDCDKGAGKVFLTTGSPAAGDDDEDRMLLGLRAMLRGSRRLAVRAGVNRGRVFAVHLGSPQRRTYTTMGDTTNLAARVMGKSPTGEVLATTAVLDRASAPFAIAPVEPFRVKGKQNVITGGVVGHLRERRRTSLETAGPIVGREPELALLRALLRDAPDGRGGAIELVGEAGIGKSRLVDEVVFQARVLGRTVIRIEAQAYGASTAYGAVRAPLRELLAAAGADDATVAAALAARLDEPARDWLSLVGIPFGLELPESPVVARLAPDVARERLHLELGGLLRTTIEPGTLLAVENAQWLDEASSELLAATLGSIGPRLATVLARREVDSGLRLQSARTIELGSLDAEAIDALVNSPDSEPLPPAVAAAVVERSHGNALFLIELLGAARAGRDVDHLPDSVEALLASRIDTLTPDDRTLLRQAAVLGSRFEPELLAGLANTEPAALPGPLMRLFAFLFTDTDGTVSFRQALARDAAYEALPFRTRRRLHRRAGELIEQRAGADLNEAEPMLSLHFDAAGDHPRSWRFSRQAAQQARRRGAPVEAATFLRRALRAGRALPDVGDAELADVGQQLGDAAELGGLYAQADAAYREARMLAAGNSVLTAELCRKQGWLRERTGSYSQALRWYTRGLSVAQTATADADVDRVKGRLQLAYGAARLRQGRLVDALRNLDQAAAIAERLDDRPTLAHASYLLDWAHTDLGRPVELYRERALRIYQELEDWTGLANTLNNLGINAFYAGDWPGALELYEHSRQARERGGDVVRAGEALHNVGELLVDQGRLDEAEPQLRSALALWRGAGFPVGIGVALMNLGRIAARRGEDDEAGRLLERARAQLEDIGSEQTIDVAVREGERHVLRGRGTEALEVLDRAREQAERRGGAPVLLAQIDRLRGWAHAQIGALGDAMQLLRASLEAATGTPYEEALTRDALARVAPLAGESADPAWAADSARTLSELGVVQTWPAPLDGSSSKVAAAGEPLRT